MISCKVCFEDIDDNSIVKYRLSEIDDFKILVYCHECLQLLMDTQWNKYVANLKTVDCEKSLLSLINDGPPINFRDTFIENNKEIYDFYYNNKIHSSKLKGSLNEIDRKRLHEKLIEIISDVQKGIDYDYLGNINKLIIELKL